MEINRDDVINAFQRMFPMQFELAKAQVIIDTQVAEIENLKAENAQLLGDRDALEA
jgi:hypothetical protein